MNNILVLLMAILFLGGIIVIFYPQLRKLGIANPKTELITETLEMTPDIERRIPISTIIPASDSTLANPGLTITWRMYLESPGGDQHWTSSFSRDKPIIRIGNSPVITYNHKYNILRVELEYGDKSPFYSHRPTIEVPHVSLQKWNTWSIVLDGHIAKVYINGIQVINKHLPMPVRLDTEDVIIGQEHNNIKGKLSNIRLYRTALKAAKLR